MHIYSLFISHLRIYLLPRTKILTSKYVCVIDITIKDGVFISGIRIDFYVICYVNYESFITAKLCNFNF